METSILVIQEFKANHDINGNPRKVVQVTQIHINGKERKTEIFHFDKNYRDTIQTVEEEIGKEKFKKFEHVQMLPSIDISTREYKRLLTH